MVERTELGRNREELRIGEIAAIRSEYFLIQKKPGPQACPLRSTPAGRVVVECDVRSSRALRHGTTSPVHYGTAFFVTRRAHSPASVAPAHLPKPLRAQFPRP